ncbi:MAG TPA: alkaline phosphatase family protein [Candidatus Dormibacteraeota bacterium]|jgi:phospholipase C|nr:alkaline phosphatase family protein [Candidatus Dormibacteraeota bacterium]
MEPFLDRRISRRALLRTGAGTAAAALGAGLSPAGLQRALAASPRRCTSLKDIEHVVILIQENRSFDHYFGTHPGVLGFSDRHALRLPDGAPVFMQPNPANVSDAPVGRLLPFRLDTSTPPPAPNGTCTEDVTHSWGAQHACWNGGRMDGFARVHLAADDPYGAATMGYYTREDVPFYRAVADAFTLCDRYFCSVLGPTDPNRLYAMTASIDADGRHGGPVTSNPGMSQYGSLSWTTYAERLQAAGVSWKQYSDPELQATSSNVLQLFAAYQSPSSELFARGVLPTYPEDFARDVLSGQLPQVSWLQINDVWSDHPPDAPGLGEDALHQLLMVLTARPDVWAKTLLLVTWDENGGFFDHVAPPVSAAGTAGEWLTAGGSQPRGPIGLGFRVPMLVISPFSRGGLICSDVLDHTSTLLFLERRFGVEVPNLSAWRRSTVADLTGALNLAAAPDASVPSLPATVTRAAPVAVACAQGGAPLNLLGQSPAPYPVPSPQHMPVQERGRARRPSGLCDDGRDRDLAVSDGNAHDIALVASGEGGATSAGALGLPLTAPVSMGVAPAVAALAVAGLVVVRARGLRRGSRPPSG